MLGFAKKMRALGGAGRAMYEAKIAWAGGSDTRFLRTHSHCIPAALLLVTAGGASREH